MNSAIKFFTVLCLFVFCTNNNLSAQNSNDIICYTPLDSSLQVRYQMRVKLMVSALYEHLTQMTLPKNVISFEERQKAKQRALELFVANGNPVKTPSGEIRPAMVQTIAARRISKKAIPIIRYFDNLIGKIMKNKGAYTSLIIKIHGDIEISSIKETDDGKTICVVSFLQFFYGEKVDHKEEYGDITLKHIKVWIMPDGTIKLFDISESLQKRR